MLSVCSCRVAARRCPCGQQICGAGYSTGSESPWLGDTPKPKIVQRCFSLTVRSIPPRKSESAEYVRFGGFRDRAKPRALGQPASTSRSMRQYDTQNGRRARVSSPGDLQANGSGQGRVRVRAGFTSPR